MKKSIIVLFLLITLSVGYFLLIPYFFDRHVNEKLPQSKTALSLPEEEMGTETQLLTPKNKELLIAQGEITGQANHQASGTLSLFKIDEKFYIRFEEDFDAENGPDLFVHLGRDGKYDPQINLGKLKGNIGSQNYVIPEGVEIKKNPEVWIWCRAFSVPFAQAKLVFIQ